MLGYGGTDKPTTIKEYTSKKVAAEVAAILDHEDLKKVIVVGHDMGGLHSYFVPLLFFRLTWSGSRQGVHPRNDSLNITQLVFRV